MRDADPLTAHLTRQPRAPTVPDDPDSVPVEWRQWLNGQQNLPPSVTPTSGANATLDRYEDVVIEERQATDAAATQPDAKAQRHDKEG